jgi:transcriptional regulator with XRE-family HTH domain
VQTSFVRDEEIYERLGQQIAARRRGLKMTQQKLATAVGMSRASIANIECGRQNVLLHHLYRFAEALKMSNAADLLPTAVGSSRHDTEYLGVPFADQSISEQTKAVMSELVSKALSQRKSKP